MFLHRNWVFTSFSAITVISIELPSSSLFQVAPTIFSHRNWVFTSFSTITVKSRASHPGRHAEGVPRAKISWIIYELPCKFLLIFGLFLFLAPQWDFFLCKNSRRTRKRWQLRFKTSWKATIECFIRVRSNMYFSFIYTHSKTEWCKWSGKGFKRYVKSCQLCFLSSMGCLHHFSQLQSSLLNYLLAFFK